MNRLKISKILQSTMEIKKILAKGWVKTKRTSKTFLFIEINDGSCLNNLQIIALNKLENWNNLKKLTTGSAISAEGKLVLSKGHNQKWELLADEINIISYADQTFPLQKKRHSDEFLRSIAHLRPRTNKYGAMFRIRSNLTWAIHKFFKNKNFTYVHTPIITKSDCEGAGKLFKITTQNQIKTNNNKINHTYSSNFFGSEVNLTVSGQLSGEMFALSLGDIYTFGPTFRAENSNTNRHIAEFWMIEPEMVFCNINDIANLGEEFIKYMIDYTMSHCTEDFCFFEKFVDKNLTKTLSNILISKFIRIEYKEAIDILKKSNQKFDFSVAFGSDLYSEHERYLTEKYFKKPIIIFNYPKDIKPFYMRLNDDNMTVGAIDILVPRIGEIIGGSQREERLDVLKKRMKELSLSKEKYWWYLDSRRYGTIKHGGFGLGFERLLMLLTGISNIRDVIPFPRTPNQIEF